MIRRSVVAFALIALMVPVAAQQRDRASIPEKYKWDLTPIYPSNAAWRAAKEKLAGRASGHSAVQRDARQVAGGARRCARTCDGAAKDILQDRARTRICGPTKTRAYAEHQGMRQEVTLLGASFGTEVAFIEPEILQIGRDKLQQFMSSEPTAGLVPFLSREICCAAAPTR